MTMEQDRQQDAFADFTVPDPGRILKVKNWLLRNGRLSKPGAAVLEIGYARGGLLDQLAGHPGLNKFALDIHPRAAKDGITFVRHDLNRGFPDFGGQRFDVIFAGEVIEHAFDDKKFLQDLRDLLKPGGTLALTTPNVFFLASRLVFPFGVMPFMAYAPFHYHLYSVETLSALAAESGYRVDKVLSSHLLISTRMNVPLGKLCEWLGDIFPSFGAHIILFAAKKD